MLSVSLQLSDAAIVFYPSFLDEQESNRLFTELTETINWRQDWITIYGRSLPQPRLTAWYSDLGKSYTYSGITMIPTPWTPILLDHRKMFAQYFQSLENHNSELTEGVI